MGRVDAGGEKQSGKRIARLTLAENVQITRHQNVKGVEGVNRRSCRNQGQGTEFGMGQYHVRKYEGGGRRT